MIKKTKKFLSLLLAMLLVLSLSFTASATVENTPDGNTVLLEHFNDSNLATTVSGELNYVNGLDGLGKAADFTGGANLKYDIPGWYQWDYSYDPAGKEGSIEFWVFPKKYGSILNLNWNNTSSPPSAGYIMNISLDSEGKVNAGTWCAITAPVLTALPLGNTVVPLEQWSHIAFTWGNNGTKVYVNGNLDASTPDNLYPALNSMVYLYLNSYGTGNIGYVDEVSISRVQKTYSPEPTPTPAPEQIIVPVLSTDMENYIQGDTAKVSLKLKNVGLEKCNSVTFEIYYDEAFELINNDPFVAVENGYIPFDTKLIVGEGSNKKLVITYLDLNGYTQLQEGGRVCTATFKVKDNPSPGIKSFTLDKVAMLSDDKVLNINNDMPVSKEVEVLTGAAAMEGYVNLYLGEGTGLGNSLVSDLDQAKVNQTFGSLKIRLKHNTNDEGVVFNGNDVFLRDAKGNLGTVVNGRLIGKYRVFAFDSEYTELSIDNVGFLRKVITINPILGQINTVSDINNPTVLYPGDIGQILNRTLSFNPDGKVISNTDFSAWLALYKKNFTSSINEYDKLRIDFSHNNEINNIDFSLWLASYKEVLSRK